jgi:hypothetical protein
VFYTGDLPRGVPYLFYTKEVTCGTQFRPVRAAMYVIP